MSRKIIPKSFKLGAHTIDVKYREDLISDQSAEGRCKFLECLIELQPSTKAMKISRSVINDTYCHELAHWLLYSIGSELYTDEKFVQSLGQQLNQYFETVKYK